MSVKKNKLKQKQGNDINQIALETLAAIVLMADGTSAEDTINAIKTSVLYKSGGTLTGSLMLKGNPTQALEAATKQYVDAVAEGLEPKAACRVATTANITLSGLQAIDGVTVVAGDRVLVKDQTSQAQNGIYIAATGTWARANDFNSASNILAASYCFIFQGTKWADTGWVLITDPPITVGTTALQFTQFSCAGDITAGTGLTKTGTTISLTNTGITPGTYRSVTIDAQGRATAGTNPTTLSGYGITDAVNNSDVVASAAANKLLRLNASGKYPIGVVEQDVNNRFVTDTQIAGWNNKARIAQGSTVPTDLADGDYFLEEML